MLPPIFSKTHFDKLYQEKLKHLKNVKPENCATSEWFQHQTLSKFEIHLHFLSGLLLSIGLFFVLGFKLGCLDMMIWQSQQALFGHYVEIKPIYYIHCAILLWFCTVLMLIIKKMFYAAVATVYGLESFTDQDDIYHYDMKANNTFIPVIQVIEKPKYKENETFQEFFKAFLDSTCNEHNRTMVTLVKKFGKWFIRNAKNTKERHEYLRTQAAVILDLTGQQEVLDFCSKMKSAWIRDDNYKCQFVFFLPNYSSDNAAIIFAGHHMLQDGRGIMQLVNTWTDDVAKTPYPFLNFQAPNVFQWAWIYLSFPYAFLQVLLHYFSNKSDMNCIKKHPVYLTGECQARCVIDMDTKKVKALAKKNGVTINDLMMALLSMSFKRYFELKGDKNSQISIIIPFSFKTIPRDVAQYSYGNKFVGTTFYMRLEKEFSKAIEYMAKESKRQFKKYAAATYVGLKLYAIFYPHHILGKVMASFGSKHTLVYTNVAGFMQPRTIRGAKMKEMYYLPTAPGSLATGLSSVSNAETIKTCVSSDMAQLDDIDGYVQIYNDLVRQYDLQYDEGKQVLGEQKDK